MLVTSASPPCLGAAAACGFACHRGLMKPLTLVPVHVFGGVYLWVHKWVWEAVKITGTNSLQIFNCFNSEK